MRINTTISRSTLLFFVFVSSSFNVFGQKQKPYPFQDSKLQMDKRVDNIVSLLTLVVK